MRLGRSDSSSAASGALAQPLELRAQCRGHLSARILRQQRREGGVIQQPVQRRNIGCPRAASNRRSLDPRSCSAATAMDCRWRDDSPFAEQQIEGDAGHIIGHGLDAGILFLIKNLAIAVALLAGLRAHRGAACLARLRRAALRSSEW